MLDWLTSLFAPSDGPDRQTRVGDPMPEPEARMWAGVLMREGIGAMVKDEGLPPYTSPMGSHFTLWVKARDADLATQIITSPPDPGDDHETTQDDLP